MAGEPLITVVGNLTADPEIRDAGSQKVASFTVAQTPRVKVGDAFEDGEATFFRCSAWGSLGENVAASLSKGSRVIVQGGMKTRSYETKEGEKRSSLEITVEAIGPELRFSTAQVERAGGGGGRRAAAAPQGRRAAEPAAQPQWSQPGAYDDETPF